MEDVASAHRATVVLQHEGVVSSEAFAANQFQALADAEREAVMRLQVQCVEGKQLEQHFARRLRRSFVRKVCVSCGNSAGIFNG